MRDPDGQPLDYGRTLRLVPAGLGNIVVHRDQACVFAGCGAPSYWCDVHHLIEWIYGGDDIEELHMEAWRLGLVNRCIAHVRRLRRYGVIRTRAGFDQGRCCGRHQRAAILGPKASQSSPSMTAPLKGWK